LRQQEAINFRFLLLVHHDPNSELILSCDASPYGVKVVLSHCFAEGVESPSHLIPEYYNNFWNTFINIWLGDAL